MSTLDGQSALRWLVFFSMLIGSGAAFSQFAADSHPALASAAVEQQLRELRDQASGEYGTAQVSVVLLDQPIGHRCRVPHDLGSTAPATSGSTPVLTICRIAVLRASQAFSISMLAEILLFGSSQAAMQDALAEAYERFGADVVSEFDTKRNQTAAKTVICTPASYVLATIPSIARKNCASSSKTAAYPKSLGEQPQRMIAVLADLLGIPKQSADLATIEHELSITTEEIVLRFVLAHELGHVLLGHVSSQATSGDRESKADLFARKLLSSGNQNVLLASSTLNLRMAYWLGGLADIWSRRVEPSLEARFREGIPHSACFLLALSKSPEVPEHVRRLVSRQDIERAEAASLGKC